VWEFISSQQAVDIVQSRIVDGATAACQALIKAAARRWQEEEGSYRDDITAIVVKLQCLWDGEDNSTTTTTTT
jgi:serine/threonine protein phosphatase PrpC